LQACANISFAVDLKTFAELNIAAVDDLVKMHLALDQQQLWKVIAIEIEQVECDQHDLFRLSLELVLKDGKIRRAVSGGNDDLAIDGSRAGSDVSGVVGNLPEALGPILAAAGENFYRFVRQVNLDAIAVELDFMNPALAGGRFVDRRRQRGVDESGVGRLDADG
jgi:hypothetical protein